MKSMFSLDSPIMKLLGLVSDLFLLNLLWLLCCLPVVTAGASTVALYFSCIRLQKDSGSVLKDFWQSFKSNFRQATVLWLLILLVLAVLLWEGYLLYTLDFAMTSFYLILYLCSVFIFGLMCVFLFPLQAWYHNPICSTLRNALLFSIGHLLYAMGMLVLSCIPLLWMVLQLESFLQFALIWLIFGVAVIVYLNCKLFLRAMEKHTAATPETL